MKLLSPLLFAPLCAAILGCDGIDISTPAHAQARGSFERTLTVSGPVDLNIRTGSGDISIRTGDGQQVRVVGRISASTRHFGTAAPERVKEVEAAPPIQQAGNIVTIGDTQGDPTYRDISISYELIVPADTRINSRTGSGDQMIGSVTAGVRAQTGSGDIAIERIGGGLHAQTGSGDIRVEAVGGAIRAQTGSGSVDLTQVTNADVEVRTGSGDVNVRLSNDAAFQLSAHTGSGSIETSHPIDIEGKRRRNRLEGIVRGGGHRVAISTGSGSIRIR
jgi:DUF4097 and DUF4098 domain-containing protein YvlB